VNSLAVVFGAGLLASLSPCVYPLLPITVGFIGTRAKDKKAFAIFSYASGQIVAFVALGAFTVFAGETLGFSSESKFVNVGVGLILLLAGTISFMGQLPKLPSLPESPSALKKFLPRKKFGLQQGRGGLIGAFSLGVGSALVASPCTSPILAGVLATMATSATLSRGLLLMFVYALGFSALFITLGFGLTRIPKSGSWLGLIQKTSSALLIAGSVYYLRRAFFNY
jgi:cytochrome c biogenesis protein CcdA